MCLYQIVDSISATPTVLFDLEATFGVADGTSFTPPPVRRSNSWTSLADGTTESDATYGDREISLTLDGFHGTAEEQVANLQALGRLLSSPQWLKVQLDGMAHPVFFRTRRADTRVVDVLMTAQPIRNLTVTLPADPFAYGLPESGSVTIRNHPLSGVNRMGAVLPAAKGDVPSPLVLSFPTPARYPSGVINVARYRSVVGSWSPRSGAAPTTPVVASPTNSGVGAQVTVTTSVDSTMARGSRYRLTPNATVGERTFSLKFNVPVAGEYRAFLRARVAAAFGNNIVYAYLGYGSQNRTVIRRSADNVTFIGPEYFDLGVVRLPRQSVSAADPFGLSPSKTGVEIPFTIGFEGNSTQVVDFDLLVLVPAGEGATLGSQSTSPLMPSWPEFVAPVTLTLDGVNDVRYAEWTTASADERAWHVGALDGGLPVVTPGRQTRLTLMPVVAASTSSFANENTEFPDEYEIGDQPLSTNTVVAWKYFPRYLYMRGIE